MSASAELRAPEAMALAAYILFLTKDQMSISPMTIDRPARRRHTAHHPLVLGTMNPRLSVYELGWPESLMFTPPGASVSRTP
jgi:hypothetical protein